VYYQQERALPRVSGAGTVSRSVQNYQAAMTQLYPCARALAMQSL
jgi:hypothetical protein